MIKASLIRIQNILGVDDVEIRPGHVTIIHGRNGEGKTSRLEAVKSVLVGGKNAFLKRIGSSEGETVVVFDNGMIATRKVNDTAKGGSLEVVHPQFKKLGAARSVLDGMLDAVSIDPQRFMDGKDEERLAILTAALSITISDQQLVDATGLPAEQVAEISKQVVGLTPLELVNHHRKHLMSVRTDSNRSVRQKESTLAQLRETLNGIDVSQDWDKTVIDLRTKAQTVTAELDAALRKNTELRDKGQQRAREDYLEARKAKRTECDRRIAEINAEFDAAVEQFIQERDATCAKFQKQADEFSCADRDRLKPLIDTAIADLTRAEETKKRVDSEKKTVALLEQFERELQFSREYSEKLTAAIEGIDQFKSSLLQSVPIPGADIRDGQLFINDVPFPTLNRQQKVEVCIEVAKLRAKAGNIGVVVFDNLECLDSDHMDEFVRQALATDLQWIVGRVSDAPGVNVEVINRED